MRRIEPSRKSEVPAPGARTETRRACSNWAQFPEGALNLVGLPVRHCDKPVPGRGGQTARGETLLDCRDQAELAPVADRHPARNRSKTSCHYHRSLATVEWHHARSSRHACARQLKGGLQKLPPSGIARSLDNAEIHDQTKLQGLDSHLSEHEVAQQSPPPGIRQ